MSSDLRSVHPATVPSRSDRRVLVIADDEVACLSLERVLGPTVETSSVRTSSETVGFGVDVVVLAGTDPLAELIAVRAHAFLYAKPVVIFAPGKDFGRIDLRSLGVASVVLDSEPVDQLLADVGGLLTVSEPDQSYIS